MKFRSPGWRWAACGGAAAITLATLSAGLPVMASAAVHAGGTARPGDPYSPAYQHSYRHGAVPTRPAARQMRAWAAQHPAAQAAVKISNLLYGGGPSGVTHGRPRVYLAFYGSQWGAAGTDGNGDVTLSGDPSGEAPYLQELFKSLGTAGEQWSGVMTQYCDGVSLGAKSCPPGSAFAGYPTGGALAGVWVDERAASPRTASPTQLGAEAVAAAAHFGNTTAASNRNAQYFIVSPQGTNPDDWLNQGFCAWHDWAGDLGLTTTYGQIAFTNLPYLTDQPTQCGQDFVNSGSGGVLDGVSMVAGHEYAETVTDQLPIEGWTDAAGNENGDKCAWIPPKTTGGSANLTIGSQTFAMQTTWANDGPGRSANANCEFAHAIAPGENTGNVITVTSPGAQTGAAGTAITSVPVTATDSGSGQALSYSAAGLPPGLAIDPSTGTITGTPSAGGKYTVTVTATDGTGVSGSASFPWAVTGPTGQLLLNPGFESGLLSPWSATSGVLQATKLAGGKYPAHGSNNFWLARLDGRGTTHTDRLSQKVAVSKSFTSATFSFWLDVQSNDPAKKAYDTLKVQVLNSRGTVLKTLATFSNKTVKRYTRHTFSLIAYRGQTITLKFTGKETLKKHNTAFLVDDTALNAS